MKTAGIIIIGDEILSGETTDTNSSFLCRELHALGWTVRRILVIPDDIDRIAEDARNFSQTFDIVLTSGGVGPTHDDVTMEGVAKGLGYTLVADPVFESIIRNAYGSNTSADHLKMAKIPEGAELIHSEEFWFPIVRVENIYILPGIPEILQDKFCALRARFQEAPFSQAQIFLKCDEGDIAPILHSTVRRFPELHLGSYPTLTNPTYTIKLSLEANTLACVTEAFIYLLDRLPRSYIVSTISPEQSQLNTEH